jgi:hypothetical protein
MCIETMQRKQKTGELLLLGLAFLRKRISLRPLNAIPCCRSYRQWTTITRAALYRVHDLHVILDGRSFVSLAPV